MENNTPLDQFSGPYPTTQEVIKRLRENGINDFYENNKGQIIINEDKSLSCTLQSDASGKWKAQIAPQWDSTQAILPAIGVFLLGTFVFKQQISMFMSAVIGIGVASLLLNKRKNDLKKRLDQILNN
jgi:hypothetical protein